MLAQDILKVLIQWLAASELWPWSSSVVHAEGSCATEPVACALWMLQLSGTKQDPSCEVMF